ncbi:MAG TPA: MFS transporter [Acidobacteriota bacterium]|nr:MFS transporter [Acidobacteriota bacterium]HQG91993.1 MFS transporter [Acidobacteriota bacterium]
MNKPSPNLKRLPAAVVALGVVSFCNDLSSEMIYPLLPLFLATTMGARAWVIGLIEGVAESTAAALKLVAGLLADRVRRRKPMLLAGYGISAAARPLIGLAGAWPFVLAMRFADRVGKGVRTSPRDALIADVTAPEIRGAAFGFHRAMDHAGAVVGPLAAAALLVGAGLELGQVFLLAAIPGVAVLVVLVAGVREPARAAPAAPPAWGVRRDWRGLGRPFHRFLLAMLVFTLGNSADAFLLLRLAQSGVPEAWVAVLWSLHHVVKMAATYVGGRLSDRLGRRRMVLAGWAVYAAVYLVFAAGPSMPGLVAAFMVYGIYFGLTEPVEKAWVADLAPTALRGAAFGSYHAVVGLGALPASLVFGLVWQAWGAPAAFGLGAALAAAAAALLVRVSAEEAITADGLNQAPKSTYNQPKE